MTFEILYVKITKTVISQREKNLPEFLTLKPF